MGRNPRSVSIPRGFARYLTAWWVHAEATGTGRPGRDILNTPGVAWEVKTAGEEKFSPPAAVRQAVKNAGGDMPVVVWFPPGVAEGSPDKAVAMMPLDRLMKLLTEAGYTP